MLKRSKGFTLIELLIVIAIIGILASLLIPNAITAMHKANMRSTQKDINTIATVMTEYITDKGVAYNQNGTYTAGSAFYTTMAPFYIAVLPVNDMWGTAFRVYGQTNSNSKYGVANASNQDYVVASCGRDGISEEGNDYITTPGAGLYTISGLTSFDHDLAMWNGQWIRGPQTRSGESGS